MFWDGFCCIVGVDLVGVRCVECVFVCLCGDGGDGGEDGVFVGCGDARGDECVDAGDVGGCDGVGMCDGMSFGAELGDVIGG